MPKKTKIGLLYILNALSCRHPKEEVEKWFRKVEAWVNKDGAFFPSEGSLEEPEVSNGFLTFFEWIFLAGEGK